jgi:hypothetical protein
LYSAKSCIFLAHEKTRTFWGIFLHSHTQSDPKQGIKKFLRHFPTALVPSLTLRISDIIHSSLESHTLEFFTYHLPYSRFQCLVTWQREVKLCKVCDGMRVLGIFDTLLWARLCKGMEKYTPKPCPRNTQLLALNES